ncbi:MAG: glycosyltransferase family 2 protein [Halobacteriovoraceae bacterium]|nr:glycosyltransferase family 2 protein [Halobacteriovoraceae bacterium]
MKNYKLSVIVPVFNEEKNVPVLIERLKKVIQNLKCDYEIIFALDPCPDKTEEVILEHRINDKNIKLLKFSRRFGQPAATMAGLAYCSGDISVVIDADLQDPPELIESLVEKWKEGNDVVFAQRRSREGETFIKKMVAYIGYWVINRITDIKIPKNTGDFRLMNRKVMDHLKKIHDNEGFLRGLVAYVGFKQIAVLYDRDARLTGTGNYNRWLGSLTIGLNGIIGFSKYPLHFISVLGLIISFGSFVLGLTYFTMKILGYEPIWGNPTLVMLISFFSGVQLLCLGIIGQYMARMYDAIKARPAYIVSDFYGTEE